MHAERFIKSSTQGSVDFQGGTCAAPCLQQAFLGGVDLSVPG